MIGSYDVQKQQWTMKLDETAVEKIRKIEEELPVPILNVVQSEKIQAPEYSGVTVTVSDDDCGSTENDVILLRSYLAQAYLAVSALTQQNQQLKTMVTDQDRKLLILSTELEKQKAERKQYENEFLDRPKSPLMREFENIGSLIDKLNENRASLGDSEAGGAISPSRRRSSLNEFNTRTNATMDVAKQIIEKNEPEEDVTDHPMDQRDDTKFLKNELKLKTQLIHLFQKSFKEMSNENVLLQENVTSMRREIEKRASELIELKREKARIGNRYEDLKSLLRKEDERYDDIEERYERDKVFAMNYGISRTMAIIEQLIESEMHRKPETRSGSLGNISLIGKKKTHKKKDEFLFKLHEQLIDVLGLEKGSIITRSDSQMHEPPKKSKLRLPGKDISWNGTL